jgi:hypothetical protein
MKMEGIFRLLILCKIKKENNKMIRKETNFLFEYYFAG